MRLFASIGILALLSGCGWFPPGGETVNPDEVNRNIFAWNGKVMLVEGWLGNCDSLNCGIYASLEDAEIVENSRFENGGWETPEWRSAMDRRLSIGASAWFDFKARLFSMRKVIVRGRVSDECSQHKNASNTSGRVKFCFDRATDLEPIQLYPAF